MNKTAFITGGTRGIGKEIAITLAKEGYDIAINYRTENEELKNTKKEIESYNVKCLTVQGDVSNFEACEKCVNEIIAEFDKIDVLVNNAGITKDALLMRMKKEDFENVIDVNLVGTFNVTKNVISHMIKAHSGKIINISSVVGISRKCRTNKLFSIKGRNNRIYKKPCKRSCRKKYISKCSSTRFYRN